MTILPLCTFPNLGYIKMLLNEDVCLDLGENYVKQSFRNKFELVGPNGRLTCTMHVVGQSSQNTPISSITLADDDWRRHAIRSIESSYGNSAFFEHYFDEIKELIYAPEQNLVQFNRTALNWVQETLGVDFKCTYSNHFIQATENDLDLRAKMKKKDVVVTTKPYPQVFEDKLGFEGNLSILDLLLNMGPEAPLYLQ
ncbi:MAG: hypothetical protein ACI80P_001064 [Flavobacteriales bacterium]|jgi:hypothetical protein